jgi:hypothetical protein
MEQGKKESDSKNKHPKGTNMRISLCDDHRLQIVLQKKKGKNLISRKDMKKQKEQCTRSFGIDFPTRIADVVDKPGLVAHR